MISRQLIDKTSSTYTYLIADEHSKEALLIDPVQEQLERDAEPTRRTWSHTAIHP